MKNPVHPQSKHTPTAQECAACEYSNKCQSGRFCVSPKIVREHKAEAKKLQEPIGWRVVSPETGMRAAVRTFDPETVVIVCYNSPTLKDIVFKQKSKAQELCKKLNKEKELHGGGKWIVKEVHNAISNSNR